jgi:hypothetical protein
VTGVALTPDGNHLIAASSKLHFWNFAESMERVKEFEKSVSE